MDHFWIFPNCNLDMDNYDVTDTENLPKVKLPLKGNHKCMAAIYLRLPYSLSGVFSYQPLTLLICVGYLQTYISIESLENSLNDGKISFFIVVFHKQIQELYFRSNAFASGGPKSRKIQFLPPLVTVLISAQFAGKKRAGNFLFVAWLVFRASSTKTPSIRNVKVKNGHHKKKSARDLGKGKWPVIISWIVHHVYMICYNFSDLFLIHHSTLKWREKKNKKTLLLQEGKKGGKKSSICINWESNPGQLIQSPMC